MCLICFTRFESFPKASWQAPFSHPSRASPSFHLHWGGSLGHNVGSSLDLSNPMPCPGELCGCLVSAECATMVGLVEWEGEGMGPLGLVVCCGVAVRRQ